MEYVFYIRNNLHDNETNTNLYSITDYTDFCSVIYVNEKMYNRHMTLYNILGKNANENLYKLHYYYDNRIDDINEYLKNYQRFYTIPIRINLNNTNWFIEPPLGA